MSLQQPKSCGFLIFRRQPDVSFLLMKHPKRWDLPKGHVDPGETDLECALRELDEETGIGSNDIQIDEHFRFLHQYEVNRKRYGKGPVQKSLIIFLAEQIHDVPINVTEHDGHQWFPWLPPHTIQTKTIDGLLEQLSIHWQAYPLGECL